MNIPVCRVVFEDIVTENSFAVTQNTDVRLHGISDFTPSESRVRRTSYGNSRPIIENLAIFELAKSIFRCSDSENTSMMNLTANGRRIAGFGSQKSNKIVENVAFGKFSQAVFRNRNSGRFGIVNFAVDKGWISRTLNRNHSCQIAMAKASESFFLNENLMDVIIGEYRFCGGFDMDS